jgi:glucose/arabinose dehydrogenase
VPTAFAADLVQRTAALTLRDCVIAAGALSVSVAIAWIGRNVSRLIEALEATRERVRALEGEVQMGEPVPLLRRLWTRQDRLQKVVGAQGDVLVALKQHVGLDWSDSYLRTEARDSGITRFDLQKPGP